MTDEQRREIERLAIVKHDASERLRWLAMCNTLTDPDEMRKAAVDYEVAIAEFAEADGKLDRARRFLAEESPLA